MRDRHWSRIRDLLDFTPGSVETDIMVRDLTLVGAIAVAVLAAGSASASAAECRNGRSTDPNCYREYGYACGPCYNDWGDRGGWRGYDGYRGDWGRHRRREHAYNCDGYGRSTDPNCYRREGYVCGPCY